MDYRPPRTHSTSRKYLGKCPVDPNRFTWGEPCDQLLLLSSTNQSVVCLKRCSNLSSYQNVYATRGLDPLVV